MTLSSGLLLAETKKPEYSPEQYQKDLKAAEQVHRDSDRMLKVDELHNLFPEVPAPVEEQSIPPDSKKNDAEINSNTDSKGAVGESVPVLPKRDGETAEGDASAVNNGVPDSNVSVTDAPANTANSKPAQKKSTATKADTGLYFPPSANSEAEIKSTNIKLSGDDFKKNERVFGIPIGTRIEVEMMSYATNVQPGFVQFVTKQTIRGKYFDLPKGSILFANPSAVKGSSNLYCRIVKGITPDDKEFNNVLGYAYNATKEAGLNGEIISDGKVLERSVTKGAVAFGGALADSLSGGAIAEASKEGLDNMITEEGKEAETKQGTAAFIVKALPQRAFIYIEKSF